jgi:hypothetical protein
MLRVPKKGKAMKVQSIEIWNTRYGQSVRLVTRGKRGKFVTNKSAQQIVRIVTKGK